MAQQTIVKVYEGASVEQEFVAAFDLIYLPIMQAGLTLKGVSVKANGGVAAACNFSLKKNGVAVTGAAPVIAAGTSTKEINNLSVALAKFDVLTLALESGQFDAPLTVSVDVDDGVSSSLDAEAVQDIVGAMMVAGTNTLWTYNDAAGTLQVAAAGLSDEEIQDKVAAFLAAGTNVAVTYNDPAGSLTISSTDANRTDEDIMDVVAAFLAQGANVTLTHNDAANSLTIAATGGSGGTSLPSQTGQSGKFLKTDGTNLSWDTPAGGTSYNGGRPDNSTLSNAFFSEDFLGGAAALNDDASRWRNGQTSGGYLGVDTTEAGHPGIITLATGSATNSNSFIYMTTVNSSNGVVKLTDTFEANFVFRSNFFNSTGSFKIGFLDNPSSTPASGIYLEKLPADTNFFGVCRTSGTQTRGDLGLAGANSTWYRLRIRRVDASTIGFKINSAAEVTINTNVTANGVTPTFFFATTSASAKSMLIDYFDLSFSNLTRY